MEDGAKRLRHRRVELAAAAAFVVIVGAPLVWRSSETAAAAPSPPPPPPSLGLLPVPVAPYRPGDQVWTREPPPVVLPLGTGCQRVPSTGYIGPGVYARTTGEYSNYWSWSASSAVEPFHWYVFSSGGTLYADGASSGGGGSTTVPANINYWKVQNLGADPQAWNVCWSG